MKEPNGEIIFADNGRMPFFDLVDEMRQTFSLSCNKIRIDLPSRVSGYILHLEEHSWFIRSLDFYYCLP